VGETGVYVVVFCTQINNPEETQLERERYVIT